jgi:hypothetical protein
LELNGTISAHNNNIHIIQNQEIIYHLGKEWFLFLLCLYKPTSFATTALDFVIVNMCAKHGGFIAMETPNLFAKLYLSQV